MKRKPRSLTSEERERIRVMAQAAVEQQRAWWEARIPPVPETGPIRVVLIGCVKEKGEERAPARELYRGQLWAARWAYAQRVAPLRTLILSAYWGVIHPDEEITPYERELRTQRLRDREAWAEGAASRVRDWGFGPSHRLHVEVHAGQPYREGLVPRLVRCGVTVTEPVAHMGIGKQKAWYAAAQAAA